MRTTVAMLGATVLATCSPPDRILSVGEVKDNILAWHGNSVSIEGWLGKCNGFDCTIWPDEGTMTAFYRAEPGTPERSNLLGQALRIGFDEEFDEAAEPLQFQHVRLTGRVDRTCSINVCLDRAADLHPAGIDAATKN